MHYDDGLASLTYTYSLWFCVKVKLTGGYYDAGDNVKFGWPMAFTVSLLSWAAVEYRTDIAAVNQLGYLQGAIRWGADFLLHAHTSATTLYTQVYSCVLGFYL